MNITIFEEQNVTIVAIEGRLDTTNYETLEKRIRPLIEGGKKAIALDCSKLQYVSSSGLRIFLITQKLIKAQGGSLVVFGLQENVHEVFSISGFVSIFELAEDKTAALALF